MAETAQDLEEHPFLAGEAVRRAADGAARLIGTECRDCGTKVFPPVHVCPECMSENVSETELSTEGTLYSWSVVHVAPKNWHVPYIAGYVDLPEGVRVFAHIVEADPDAMTMDMGVSLMTAVLGEADGEPVESYAFTPAKG
ncbi:MAG: Zn-ribbon domain-containing OB-fold protein [Alphaproteobacteria bacterium]|jgi:uncharacterized OB-fold protein